MDKTQHSKLGDKTNPFQTDDEILAAFGANDSEDEENYDEADEAERKRDSNEQGGGGGCP